MKKFRSVVVGATLVGLYSLLATTAFALLSPQAGLSSFTLRTAQLDLQIGNSSGGPFTPELQLDTNEYLLPNSIAHTQDFWVRNTSSSGLEFQLTEQLGEGDQDWLALKDVIEIRVSNLITDTGWLSLQEWEQSAVSFPGILGSGSTQRYQFSYRLPDTYGVDPDGVGPLQVGDAVGEELEGKITSNMSFTISGVLQ